MFKFLPGILIIQFITTALVLTGFNWSNDPQLIIVIISFALIVGILAAFWFASIARDIHKMAESKMQKEHMQERERILVKAEQEKASLASESYRQIEKATNKAHAKANFKVGIACAAAMGVGGLMIFSQLVTVGMMVLIGSGSGLAGYLARVRQERLSRNRQLFVENEIKLINQQMPVSSTGSSHPAETPAGKRTQY